MNIDGMREEVLRLWREAGGGDEDLQVVVRMDGFGTFLSVLAGTMGQEITVSEAERRMSLDEFSERWLVPMVSMLVEHRAVGING